MYTIFIGILILATPLIVMPRDISGGKLSPYACVLKSIITTLTGVLILFAVIRFTGQSLFDIYHDYFDKAVDILVQNENMRQLLGAEGISDAAAHKQMMAFYDKVLAYVPGFILVASTVVSYFAYIFISRAQSKKKNVQLMPPIKEFSFPPQTLTAVVGMYLLALILDKLEMLPNEFIFANINYMFDWVFVIQGISVIFFFCSLKRIPKAVAVILSLVFWNFYMLRQLLVIIGMVDMIFGIKGFLTFKDQMKGQKGPNRRNRRK